MKNRLVSFVVGLDKATKVQEAISEQFGISTEIEAIEQLNQYKLHITEHVTQEQFVKVKFFIMGVLFTLTHSFQSDKAKSYEAQMSGK